MAHLKPPDRPMDNRGQLMLIIGFTLAVAFVALALILNTAIYAENLSTRSETGLDSSPVDVRDETRDGTASLLEYINEYNNTDHTSISDNLDKAVKQYASIAGRRGASNGQILHLSLENFRPGTRLVQTDSGRNLTNRNNTANWTLASGVRARSVTMDIADQSPGTCSVTGSCFRMNATDGSDTWTMAVYENATDMVVEIETMNNDIYTCSPSPDGNTTARINLSEGTVDGQKCKGLQTGVPDPPYDLAFTHGDEAKGTFDMIVNEDSIVSFPDTDRYHPSGSSDSPRVAYAGYATTIRIEQYSENMVYNGTVRVAPGEWP